MSDKPEKPAVNFLVQSCITDVELTKDLQHLDYTSTYRLEKESPDAGADRWSLNETDVNIPIEKLRVLKHSSNVICSEPQTEGISRGRMAHHINLSAPDSTPLPIVSTPIEFTLKYEKPLVKGLNYDLFTPLPFLNLRIIHFEPIGVFNKCKMISYRFHDHDDLTILASLPNRYGKSNDASIFEKQNLERDESYPWAVILGPKGLNKKTSGKALKLLLWLIVKFFLGGIK